MKSECSVLSKSSRKDESCLTKKQVVNITKLHNKNYCFEKNCYIPISLSKSKLLKNLQKSLDINDERRLASFDFIKKDKITYYALKKLMYKKRLGYRQNGWLNTYDINDVMTQYAMRYNFKYIGAVPSDYFKFHPFNKTFPSYVIFNLDPTHKPGSHWIGMVIDENKEVDYFDSNGVKPNRNINKFISMIGGRLRWYNKSRLQNKDGLCGVYAMYFLISKAKKKCIVLDSKSSDKIIQESKREYFL